MTAASLIVVAVGILLGVGVPVLTIRMIVPSLEQGRLVENYRGRKVFVGLGVAWLVWAGAAIVMGVVGAAVGGEASLLPLLTLAGPLALVCFALGLFDDAFGTGASRGFRGHLAAFRQGRLTTGGLKLIGISAASLVAAAVVMQAVTGGGNEVDPALILAVPAGAAIALTANFVNLMDLRPVRASKVYIVLAVFGVISSVIGMGGVVDAPWSGRLLDAGVLVLFVLGPVIATWSHDAGERGMLGDAGANAAGAVAGLLIVAGLPPYGMFAYLVLMLALNIASERVSFSRIIERNDFLRWADGLGRPKPDGNTAQNGTPSDTNPE